MPVLARFERLWSDLGLAPSNACDAAYHDLAKRYAEPHRRYHNFEHIDFCLQHWAENQAATRWQHPVLVAAAIWFHDSVYDTHAHDNEAQSAALADRTLPLHAECKAIIHELIMDTCHQVKPATPDGQLFADIDLCGIGGTSEKFAEGCQQIRAEYSWVEPAAYRDARSKFLNSLLHRPQIYYTTYYLERFEAAARRNLQEELDRLQKM